MDINTIATEFIEVNQRRRELEKREEYLKGILAEHFQATKTLSLDTDRGTIRYQASQHTDYDIPLLREILPESIFQLVTRLSVNDALLTQLIKDGKIDDARVARARRVSSVYRIVVQSLSNLSPIRLTRKESPASPPVDSRKIKEQPKKAEQPQKRSRKPRDKKPPL